VNIQIVSAAIPQYFPDQMRQMIDSDVYFGDACFPQLKQKDFDYWLATDRDQRLGQIGSERFQAGAHTAGKYDCF